MAEIVNLRMARKRKARDARERQAQENRQLHGLTKTEREVARLVREREDTHLEGHRREGGDDER